MADPLPFEAQAASLKLRAKPRPVTEINRKVVIFAAGALILLLFMAASTALDPPKVSNEDEREYLSLKLDDPSFAAPIRAALFESPDDKTGVMVWNRS